MMQSVLNEDALGIRRFNNPEIQRHIDDAISRLDTTGKNFIAVGHIDETGDYKLSAAVRIGDHFSISAAAYDNWKRPTGLKYKADVVFAL